MLVPTGEICVELDWNKRLRVNQTPEKGPLQSPKAICTHRIKRNSKNSCNRWFWWLTLLFFCVYSVLLGFWTAASHCVRREARRHVWGALSLKSLKDTSDGDGLKRGQRVFTFWKKKLSFCQIIQHFENYSRPSSLCKHCWPRERFFFSHYSRTFTQFFCTAPLRPHGFLPSPWQHLAFLCTVCPHLHSIRNTSSFCFANKRRNFNFKLHLISASFSYYSAIV